MAYDFDAVRSLVVCPGCRSELQLSDSALLCLNPDCRRLYEIRDGIPVLLTDSATVLTPEEWSVRAGNQAGESELADTPPADPDDSAADS